MTTTQQQRERYATDPEYRERKCARNNAWARGNRDKINDRQRKRYSTDPEFRAKERARAKKDRRRRICRVYGLTVPEYEALLAQQQGACGICRRPFRSTPCIDHCHLTGWVRGLLCHPCNRGLGFYEDNPAFLAQASDYMQRWVEHLIACFYTKENKKMSKQDTSDESKTAKLIREAILKELRQPFGIAAAPPTDRLEAVARALIDKAEERDVLAIKEVFDRAGGSTQSASGAVPRVLNVSWQNPLSKPKLRAAPSTSSRGRPPSNTKNVSPTS